MLLDCINLSYEVFKKLYIAVFRNLFRLGNFRLERRSLSVREAKDSSQREFQNSTIFGAFAKKQSQPEKKTVEKVFEERLQ